MNGDIECRLNNRQKTVGILVICLIFSFVLIVCLRLQNKTHTYDFDLKNLELKTAVFNDGSIISEEAGEDYTFATKPFVLPTDRYRLEIEYISSAEGIALVQGNNDCVFEIQMPPTYGEKNIITNDHLILSHGTDRGKIKFFQKEPGEISVSRITITSDHHMYSDYKFIALFAGVITAALITLILIFNKLKLTRTRMSYLGLFAIAIIVVNIPFCVYGTYYEVDTQAHMKRIEAIVQGIHDRQFPVIVGPNYANQYGELVALQPGLFLYIPAFLRLFNVSVPTAYNFYMILVNVATGIVAFLCAERMFGTIRWAIVAAVFYLMEPFRIYVMLKLGAGAGMGTALIFLPFLIMGMHETMNKRGARWKYISIGLWGMACSHVMGFALAVIGMFAYILFHFKRMFEKGVFTALLKAAVVFALMSLGALVPFVGYYFTKWNRSALAWTDFYHIPIEWNAVIQTVIAMAVLITAYIGVKQTGFLTRFGRGIFVMGFVFVIMSSGLFPWFLFKKIGPVDSFLSMMQYPLRFHFLAVPYVSYAAAEAVCSNMDSRTRIRKKILYIIVGLFGVGVLLETIEYFKVDKLFGDPVSGEINTVMEDYLPEGTLSEWYENDTGEFSDYDAIKAYSYSKVNTHVDCSYTCRLDGQYMELPMFYYDGYAAYDQDGKRLRVDKGERNRVRVYLTKSNEIQEFHLRFEVNRLYKAVFIFSLIFGMVWLVYNIYDLLIKAIKSKRITK